MGCCTSKVEDSTSAAEVPKREDPGKVETAQPEEVPQTQNERPATETVTTEDDAETNIHNTTRLLLLGAAESGKTTVLEQIRLLYNHDYTEAELMHLRSFMYENIVLAMFEMLRFMEDAGEPLSNPANATNAELVKTELEGTFSPFTDTQVEALKSLWNDQGVQAVYSRRGEYNLNDSIKYFYENLDRINAIDFKPTPHDMIMAYCPTTGVQNINFTTKNHTYQLFDFGGQKNDRRKWPLIYDGIKAVIFCIAISEYDQKLSDDGTTIRLHDALELLEHICSEPKFHSTWIIVFLNKIDLFREKLTRLPLNNFMPDYEGSNDFHDAKAYIEKIVQARCSNHPDLLHFEFTCAIDTDEMKKILERTFKILRHKKS